MALFSDKKDKEAKPAKAAKPATVDSLPAALYSSQNLSHIIIKPRITEKATDSEAMGMYTFDVAERANKQQIIQAVKALYKVTPRMVRVVKVRSKIKKNVRTGKSGIKGGGKKAYVYLKKGDTITLN